MMMSTAKMLRIFIQLPLAVELFRLRRGIAPASVMFGAALLSGCATQGVTGEDRIGSMMVAPGKYEFYTCAHLAAMTASLKVRERELEALIARAGPGAGGSLVSAVSYQPEYLQARGNLAEVRRAEAAKNCPPSVAAAPPSPPAVTRKPKGR